MDLALKEKHVLVTGSAGGIGYTTAKTFLEQGAFVTLHYNSKLTEELSLLNKQYPDHSQCIQVNATNEQQVIQCVKQCTTTNQNSKRPIDILVLNHGIFPEQDVNVIDMSLEQWNNTLNVNLTGYFLFAREYLRQLKESGLQNGNIVMVGSTSGIFGEAGHADYSSSKSALNGLMNTLKNEIVKFCANGRVNIVAPGWTRTPMAEQTMQNQAVLSKVYQTMPLRKVATTDDVANTSK
jgi:NAD(P)-dependent dehydrogenase (short-subunit alcohol dehydrogenase family)